MRDWKAQNERQLAKAREMADWLVSALVSHDDNSGEGVTCHQDMFGHHSCYTCNLIEDLLKTFNELKERYGRGPGL